MKAQPDHPMTFLLHKMRIPQNANLLEKKPLNGRLDVFYNIKATLLWPNYSQRFTNECMILHKQ